MAKVRVLYGSLPNWPATDQHPQAERFFLVGDKIMPEKEWAENKPEFTRVIDSIGTPTLADIEPLMPTKVA